MFSEVDLADGWKAVLKDIFGSDRDVFEYDDALGMDAPKRRVMFGVSLSSDLTVRMQGGPVTRAGVLYTTCVGSTLYEVRWARDRLTSALLHKPVPSLGIHRVKQDAPPDEPLRDGDVYSGYSEWTFFIPRKEA